jgi:hypothetical protein
MDNNEEIMILITDFVEDYQKCESDDLKYNLLCSVVKEDAITRYSSKMAVADMIFERSHIDQDGNFKINTAREEQQYILALISFYTYLRKPEEATDDDIYDYLNFYNIINPLVDLIKAMNQKDIEDFNKVFKILKDDFITMHTGRLLTINNIQNAVEEGIINAVFRILKALPENEQNT